MSRTRAKSLASHAALVPTTPPKPPPAGFWDDGAVLAMPVTDRDAGRAEEAERRQQKDAARGVARWSMLDAHGCTGRGCRSAEHSAGAEVRDELLDVLGVGE
jgi:hypothetical protein